jgi:hypothetical protein
MFKPNFSCCSGEADLPNKIDNEICVLSFNKSSTFLKDLTFDNVQYYRKNYNMNPLFIISVSLCFYIHIFSVLGTEFNCI